MIAIAGVSLALALSGAADGTTPKPAPEFKPDKWYNSVPITLDDLKGKAVLIQVFRTW
jgi:hypothetical protein